MFNEKNFITSIDNFENDEDHSEDELARGDPSEDIIKSKHMVLNEKDLIVLLSRKSDKELIDDILNFDLNISHRIITLKVLNNLYSDSIIDLINRLNGMYIFSKSKFVEEFIYKICMSCDFLLYTDKILLGQSLCSHEDEKGYEVLDMILMNTLGARGDTLGVNSKEIPTPLRLETIKTLFDSEKHRTNSEEYFLELIDRNNLDCEWRYKTILSLEDEYFSDDEENDEENDDKENDDKENDEDIYNKKYNKFIIDLISYSFFIFFKNETNDITLRLLSAQYLYQNNLLQKEHQYIEDTLFYISENTETDYNIRADATDILLKYSNNKEKAKSIILKLGKEDHVSGKTNKVRTIFENAQNVHYNEFEKSVNEGIDFLNTIPTMKINDMEIDFEYIKNEIIKIISKSNRSKVTPDKTDNHSQDNKDFSLDKISNFEKIKISLNRIDIDRALYSKYNCTLAGILIKVWTYIFDKERDQEQQKEMTWRLFQELEDMAGICSTGFAERIVNVISGFGDFNFRISWEEQIVSNFSGRLNKRARDIIENYNSIHNLEIISNILIQNDYYTETNIIKIYMKSKNLFTPEGKYDRYVQVGDYEKIVDVFKDEVLFKSLKNKLSVNNDYPLLSEKYNCFIKFLYNEFEIDDPNTYILEKFQENVLNELTVDTSKSTDRRCFLTFLGEELLSIREELYEEFKDLISSNDFDTYFRTAISRYETA